MRWICMVVATAGWWAWAGAGVPTTAPTTAPTSRPAAVQARIDVLLRQLGADAWEDRQAAQDELVKMGAEVMPDLERLVRMTNDEEVRARGGAALAMLRISPLPKQTLDVGKGVEMRFVLIPAGKFTMGSPATEVERRNNEMQHEVTISKAFWMGVTEVTQAQWKAVMGDDPSEVKGTDLPVERISWDEAVAFCRLLQARGMKARLPTEAEWEYACRAGTAGKSYGPIDAVAWHSGNSGRQTHRVGTKQANAWGLYDMLGNVWEMCYDAYKNDLSEDLLDPAFEGNAGADHVLRGASWYNAAGICRAASRYWCSRDNRDVNLGLRVVVDPP